ncbi:MAG: beta-galactosidase small subunit, partial [Saprospiraceae bacterium]|nr:beta-galactosidase small subunit [Saprospiraceae bacterium]
DWAGMDPIGGAKIQEEGEHIRINFDGGVVTFSKEAGFLIGYIVRGKNLLSSPMAPNFWRAPNDNDRAWGINHHQVWKEAGKASKLESIDMSEDEGVAQLHTVHSIGVLGSMTTSYLVGDDGQVKVDLIFDFRTDQPELPKVGMKVLVPEEFSNAKYYGKGPHESYIDRDGSARLGIYNSEVAQLSTPYIRPQENGNRSGIRWFSLKNAEGMGLKIRGNDLNVSARTRTTEDLENTTHRHLLPTRDFIEVNIDHKIMGVGGDDTWSIRSKPHPEDRIPSGKYRYNFVLSGI